MAHRIPRVGNAAAACGCIDSLGEEDTRRPSAAQRDDAASGGANLAVGAFWFATGRSPWPGLALAEGTALRWGFYWS